jgi:uncharacterized membrane protein (DUF373 family)
LPVSTPEAPERRRFDPLLIFETIIVYALLVLLVIVIATATGQLFVLLFRNIADRLQETTDNLVLQENLQRAFGGVLGVLLGLELMETVRHYRQEHHVRVEIVFIVAMIAVGRHVIQLEYHTAQPMQMVGTAAMVLALAYGYYLLRRAAAGRD